MKNCTRWPLRLRLKGDRNYIQGGDIYNAVNNLASALTGEQDAYLAKLAFRTFARRDCDISLNRPRKEEELIGTGAINWGQRGSKKIWLVESGRPAGDRYEYDENIIIAPAVIEGNRATITHTTPYSPIEEIVALTKLLTINLFPDVHGKWVFAQLNLIQPLYYRKAVLCIELTSKIGESFTVNDIYQDDIRLGEIRFIVGEP